MNTNLYLSTNSKIRIAIVPIPSLGYSSIYYFYGAVNGISVFDPDEYVVGKSITFRTPNGDVTTVIKEYVNSTHFTVEHVFPVGMKNIYYYFGYEPVDLYDDVPFTLTYAIADVRHPEKRDTTYAKTVLIPGTPQNNIIFGHCFEIDIDGTFNPNIKALAVLDIDTIEQFRGVCQLLKIIRREGDKIDYEISLYGTTGGFLFGLSNLELRDLDLSVYNHTPTKLNIVKSWNEYIIKSGNTYYNFNGPVSNAFVNGAPNGEGYVYPLIDTGFAELSQPSPTFDYRYLPPCIYLKSIVDAMFKATNYTYTSTFLNGDDNTGLFTKLIIMGKWANRIKVTVSSKVERLDPGNNGFTGHFTHKLILDNLATSITTPYYGVDTQIPDNETVIVKDIFEVTVLPGDTIHLGLVNAYTDDSGNAPLHVLPDIDNTYFSVEVLDSVGLGNQNVLVADTGTTVNVPGSTNSLPMDYDVTIYDLNNAYDLVADEYLVGGTINLQDALPAKVKCADFFLSLMKMFNLYLDRDPANTRNLIIEPRDIYYASGITVNWTEKLDFTQDLEQIPMGELDFKSLRFTYKEDGDFWNAKYKKDYNEVHGEVTVNVDNDFVKNTNVNELIFAPTPSVQSGNNKLIVPVVIKDDPASATNPNVFDNPQPRILIYGGMKFCSPDGFVLRVGDADPSPDHFTLKYPYAGMWDDTGVDPVAPGPTYSIMFGLPREIYWILTSTSQIADLQDLFQMYHSTYVAEIADKDSKVIIGRLHFNPVDIMELDFRNRIFMDGHYLRLNKIVEYDVVTDKITKVEFLKVKKQAPFKAGAIAPITPSEMYNIVEGSLDEIRDLGASSFYSAIEGSLDEVINIGASSSIKVINGG